MTKTPITAETVNPMDEKLSALRDLFPEAFREDRLDTDLLASTLGDRVSTEKEAYGMTWAGKADARKQILTSTSHTLAGDEKASVYWDTTKNIFIEGDNLTVLKLLQKGYTKQVKMIYIDPPYNTGSDFVYDDNFHTDKTEYETITGQRTTEGVKMVANTETNGRYHSDWLSMMYPRLHLARNLLRDDGVIFVSIDDHEVHNLRKIMDEVFGEENFITQIVWQKKKGGGNDSNFMAVEHEYIMLYGKNLSELDELTSMYSEKYLTRYKEEDEKSKFFWDTFKRKSGKQYYPVKCPDGTIIEHDNLGNRISWLRSEKTFLQNIEDGEIKFEKTKDSWSIFFKQRLPKGKTPRSILQQHGTTSSGSAELLELFEKNIFENPKPKDLIRHLLEIGSSNDCTVLDFFAGSGTTGHAVMALNAQEKAEAMKNDTNPDEAGNRQYICVQLPELTDEKKEAFKAGYKKISEITAERLRRAGKKIAEENKELTLDTGFRLYRLTDSCYKVANVNYDSDNEQATLESFEKALKSGLSPLRDGVTEDDIITENLIKEGFPLNIALSKKQIGETAFIHAETEGKRLYISFDSSVPLETIDAVQKGYNEAIFVVYDSALTDPLKVMLASRVTLRTI